MADPYTALRGYFEIPEGDPRVYAVAKKLIDQGIDPAEWVAAQMGGPMPTRKEMGQVDPRGMRPTGTTRAGDKLVEGKRVAERVGGTATGPVIDGEQTRHYNPTEDEMLGLDEGMDEPSFLTSAGATVASTATNPKKRREFERGLSDVITLGLAERAARALAPAFGDESFSERQAAEDAEAAEGYRAAGQVFGAFTPGATNYIGRQTAGGVSRLAGLGKGPVLGAGIGVAGGAASAPLVAAASEAGRTAVEAPFSEDVGVSDIPRRAWQAGKAAATNPNTMMLAGTAGGLGGLSAGIRTGESQAGRDLRLGEKYGAEPSVSKGLKGDVYKDPLLRDVRGTAENVGEVSRDAADTIRGTLSARMDAAGKTLGAGKQRMKTDGALDVRLDVTPVEDAATAVLNSTRTTSATANSIKTDVMAKLERFRSDDGRVYMTAEQLNDFKGLLGDLAGMSTKGSKVRKFKDVQMGRIWGAADDVAAQGPEELEALNTAYSQAANKSQRAHRQLGLGNVKKTAPDDTVAANKLAVELERRAGNTRITGRKNRDFERFVAENPDLETTAMAPALLGARERLRFRLPEGDFIQAARGLAAANVEPLMGTVINPLGRVAGQQAGLVPALRNPVEELLDIRDRRNRERGDTFVRRR